MTDVIARKSGFLARLTANASERIAAQRLRNLVFKGNGNDRDEDRFDDISDHLLVIRERAAGPAAFTLADGDLVGTYRLIRQQKGAPAQAFYAAQEYDIAPLLARKQDHAFLELGRSCVRADMRDQPVAELLWQGIWNYAREHRIDVMMGCASFDGVDPEAHAVALTYLAHKAEAPVDWQVRALPERFSDMRRRPIAAVDERSALRLLPPLIKGYVRLGCHVGEGAVVDHDFNTTDVLIVLPISAIKPRYFRHFGAPAA
jgi:L-ornithine Nalpha-acyltransferase